MIKEITIDLEGTELVITGEYHEEEYGNGLSERFEIEHIASNKGNLYDLLEYVSCRSMTYMQTIEELCLEQINS